MRTVFAPSVLSLACLSHFGQSFSSLPVRPLHGLSTAHSAVAIDQGLEGINHRREISRRGRTLRSDQRGWHRNILTRMFRKKQSEGSKSGQTTRRNAAAVPLDAQTTKIAGSLVQDDFVLRNFERKTPQELFVDPLTNHSLPLVETSTSSAVDVPPVKTNAERKSRIHRLSQSTFKNILEERLDRWSNGSSVNVQVSCDPKGSFLQLFRGRFQCDATIELERIIFDNIRFSGGHLKAKDFALNLLSFTNLQSSPRYPQRFDLLAKNLTFTQEDLFESSCIRNGLRRLLTRILRRYGMDSPQVTIRSIKIFSNRKISVVGEATPLLGTPVPFEVRSGLAFSRRGHVLDFVGLELSIHPALGVFVPVIPTVTVDLGHNAQLLDLQIDDTVRLSAKVTITPDHTILLKNYSQCSSSFGALCSIDVGRWLTRIGRFAD